MSPWATTQATPSPGKTQLLEHQCFYVSDGIAVSWTLPALPSCTFSCNQYVTGIRRQSKKLQKHGVVFFFPLSTSHLLPVNVEHNPLCRKSNKQNCKASVLQLDPSPWQRVNLSHGKQLGIDSISFLYCASQPVHSFQPKSKKIGGKRKVKEFCIRRGSGSKRGKWSLPQCYHDHILQVSSPALPLLN